MRQNQAKQRAAFIAALRRIDAVAAADLLDLSIDLVQRRQGAGMVKNGIALCVGQLIPNAEQRGPEGIPTIVTRKE